MPCIIILNPNTIEGFPCRILICMHTLFRVPSSSCWWYQRQKLAQLFINIYIVFYIVFNYYQTATYPKHCICLQHGWSNNKCRIRVPRDFCSFLCGYLRGVSPLLLSQITPWRYPNLARFLGVSQKNFQTLLVACGHGSLWKNGQFILKKNQFDSFLNLHKLQDTRELVYCQPKGFRHQHWLVKVGTKLWNDAATPQAKGIASQICNIRSLRASSQDEVLRTTLAWRNQQIQSSEDSLSDFMGMGHNQKREAK